jgi:outer membrane immunogenic protein
MLKKVVFGAAIAVATAGAASGADLALKAPAAAAVKFTWTGCYVGGHIGGGVSEDRTTNNLGNSLDFSSPGFVGGGQIGCDYQFAPNWVVGAEGRAAWTSFETNRRETVRFSGLGGLRVPSQFHIGNDFLASATARLGYVYAERWLVYARGGAAWTREKLDDAFIAPVLGTPTDPSATVSRTGWTAGAGVEWAFAPHWSVNVEYNYYDFGTKGVLLTGSANSVTIAGVKDTIHAATVGVNYHF